MRERRQRVVELAAALRVSRSSSQPGAEGENAPLSHNKGIGSQWE